MLLRFVVVALLVGTVISQVSRSRISRPRLRARPDQGELNVNSKETKDSQGQDIEDTNSQKESRQLDRTRERSRIQRPSIRRRPAENDVFLVEAESEEEEDIRGSLSQIRGGFQDEDIESPRFTPSRGGGINTDRSPDRFRSSSSTRTNVISSSDNRKDSKYKLVCYYTNWSQYRPKIGQFFPEDIDPFLCTHLIFAFGWLKNGKLASFEENDENGGGKVGLYDRVINLKTKNPDLKVLLAIGGWSFGTAKFKEVAKTRFTRQIFVFSAVKFLREHNFDGLDMDWEYPKSSDKDNFSALLKELSEAFTYEAEESGKERLLLSAAVPVGPDNVRGGYDVPAVSEALDFVNLMAYDFHGKWESQAGHNAPLYAPSSDSEWRKQLSVEFAAKMWTRLGTPKEKLVIGMPTYGRSFSLTDPGVYAVNSATKGGGTAGEYTREAGFLSYYEICEMLHNGANYIWDDEMKVPYLVQGDQWVGFDDERAIRNKMDWVKDNGYAGAMVWTVDMDDFNGTICGSGVKYPLIGAMREELFGIPRDTVSRDIEPSDIDWEKLNPNLISARPKPPPAERIDVEEILNKISRPKNPLPLLNTPVLPENVREPVVFCYFTNWSYKRPGMGKFTPEDVDPTLCTHIVYAFATIKDNKLASSEENDEGELGGYDRILKLREKNPSLKILVAVGGWAFGSKPFQSLTENIFRMNGFVYDSIEFLRKHKFDGLDIDWEYPRGPDDKASFVSLIKELRLAIEGEAKGSKEPKLLLTAAVPASFEAIEAGYDVPEISKYLDFINVMTYDFHGQWEKEVGHNSPLYPLNSATGIKKRLTVDFSAKEWVRQGAPSEKLIIGMPVYGRTFTLEDPTQFDIGAQATSGGDPGRYTGEAGFLSYYEICDFLHKDNTTLVWDNEQQVPFAYRGQQWVGFDDERSLKTKTSWLKEEGFGGIMVWSVDLDDFRGYCGTGKYPLIKSMKNELKDYLVPLVYEGPYETPRGGARDTVDPDEVICEEGDAHVSFARDKKDCSMYYVCQGSVKHHKPCPTGLVFNENDNVCDWPENVSECSKPA
ncbi:probable chitinase 10 [Eurytemora carolleeae]|uniref:probable chitinase 10 n=1 Tax=Eurytemora carolleeae TaxID=1294199 RepID=UPI000C78DAE1|nr:probable chitinase 10 [Eurytemora carolleeae]|eukprot:XP_023333989.1 probable chitinase 10 [Eurytemora affinis]